MKKIRINIKKPSKRINIKICDLDPKDSLYNKCILVSGPLGQVRYKFDAQTENSSVFVNSKELNFLKRKIKKLIFSVTKGWYIEISLNGVGYKSFKLNGKIALDIGYSNLVIYNPNIKVWMKNFKNKIVLFSIEEVYVKNVAALLRNYSIPDLYKGKGLLLKDEIVKLKKKSKK